MVRELSGLPLEVLESILSPFCGPRDLPQLLAASRGLRALRRGCVTSLLEKLFEGKPGAHHALPWVRLHHGDKSGEYGLDDIGLVDWMYGLRDVAATGAYRASLGEAHTVVVTPGGRALAAGNGRHGVLGESGNMNRFLFTEMDLKWGQFPGRIPVTAVACGDRHTLLLTAVGTVHSCGLGEYGRLGHGNERSLSRPTLIQSLIGERITQIAGGQAHSVAISWKGEAFTWGWGFKYVLGHGDELDRLNPTRLVIPPITFADANGASLSGSGVVARARVGSGDGGGGYAGISTDDASHVGLVLGTRESGLVAVDAWVTCAAAGKSCTVLGTRCGRVLAAGVIGVDDDAGGVHGFRLREFGRLAAGRRCWRVQCARFRDHAAEMVLVIDSGGEAHQLYRVGTMWACHQMPVQACREELQNDSSGSGSGSGPERGVVASSTRSPRPLMPEPPFARCLSALVSPATKGTCLSWMENGDSDWGGGDSFVVISADGHLLSSAGTGRNDQLRRRRGDMVVHASAWIESLGDKSHGLLLVDGGASVVTHGNARTGHLGHGIPGYEPAPKKVTAAVILGGTVRGGRGWVRSNNAQISAVESSAPSGGASGDGGGRWVGLLARVDAAADERDAQDDRALAEEEDDREEDEEEVLCRT